MSSYQLRLLAFLSVATFFEGYDFYALAMVLPQLREEFGLDKAWGGAVVAFANLGTVAAFGLVRYADQVGRRRVMQITILGYCAASLATAFAPNIYLLVLCQFVARLFLIGEWGVAMVIAAEEFPAEKRGTVLGIVQAASALGSIACAAMMPTIASTTFGWRAVFLVSVVPLLLIAVARRSMRETSRFEASVTRGAASMIALIRGPYRTRILELAIPWALTFACTQSAITFFKEYAIEDRGQTEPEVARILAIAAVIAMPPLFFAGALIDRIGRRIGALVMYAVLIVGVALAYGTTDPRLQTFALACGVFGSSAVLPVLNAYTTERFPTEVRADAFAWTNNLLGRTGYVLGPLFVGIAANQTGWGPAVAVTTIGPVLAVLILWWRLPETGGRELEDTAKLA